MGRVVYGKQRCGVSTEELSFMFGSQDDIRCECKLHVVTKEEIKVIALCFVLLA